MGKSRKLRRQKYDRDNRLRLEGQMTQERPVVAAPSAWSRALTWLVDALPTHKLNRQGRQRALVMRLSIGVVAAALVTYGKDSWIFGLMGVLVALSALFIPTSDVRQRRWRRQLTESRGQRTERLDVPAGVEFDGRKVSIRIDGRVWRSLRPFEGDVMPALYHHEDVVWIALESPHKDDKTPGLYFSSPYPALADEVTPEAAEQPTPVDAVRLTSDAFREAHGAFIHRLWVRSS